MAVLGINFISLPSDQAGIVNLISFVVGLTRTDATLSVNGSKAQSAVSLLRPNAKRRSHCSLVVHICELKLNLVLITILPLLYENQIPNYQKKSYYLYLAK